MTEAIPRDAVWLNDNLRRGPFHRWLGVEVVAVVHAAGTVELRVPWREEFGNSPQSAHGGLLSALVDVTAFFTVAGATGRPPVTVDARTDYHLRAPAGELTLRGTLTHAGRSLANVEIAITGADGTRYASGRAVMSMPPADRIRTLGPG